ncbi:MAG: glycosyltransferase family 2 protein [Chlorobium sp.]|uniref:glycosyltransferase family 2 protein n=1 Tax=Chlorobium sp. TaxID=1095 RepID=UPI0025B91652|nr:glycosyltransferase family A protein [Chlorobium sp.]MCF8216376.1 glycosyltransferase family 2 protein [Chlorobium sp.]MCF8271279.1 glycosyltransferase family 2 protein [Chlorobium sp.]MCF8287653.1 glycosyltransferase family 2 protein [Chlorobium sp.]MCF8291220.1 glycosyltransferase family 2 protein [Chlorobium sp.]MCF8385287.1 glycosyltransferase family 2 protein [Chlorobium sp.]
MPIGEGFFYFESINSGYNNARFIGDTIHSILSQTFTDFELLIYDDFSNDESFDIAASFSDSRIKLYKNPHNLGPEKNWNRAIGDVRGQYVKLVCGDDILFPECLERQVAVFDYPKHSGVSLVSCPRTIIDPEGKPLIKKVDFVSGGRIGSVDVIRKMIRMGTNIIGEPVCGLYPAELIARTSGYSAIVPYTIDLDFWIQLLKHGDLYMIDEPLCAFRISNESWSSRIGDMRYRQFIEFMEQAAADKSHEVTDLDMFIGRINCAVQSMTSLMGFKLFASHE